MTPAAASVPLEGLADQAAMLADGSTSSVALVERALARAEASRATLNAFWSVRPEAALEEAHAADRRLAAGERLPLLGVPVAIKDEIDLAGESTQFGTACTWPPATADSESVRRLRAAGAIVIGKTTASELGQFPVTASDHCGVTRNPWDLDLTPGGSSGGSAAAVAAGIVAAAVGCDGAGSIRIPAAWTHLVGIKPQRGRVSTWPDLDVWQGLAVVGPLARTVGDAALLLDAICGNHADDDVRLPPPAQPFAAAAQREPGKLTIAVSRAIPFNGSPRHEDPDVDAALDRMVDVLRDLGHTVIEADPRYGPQLGATFMPRSMVGLRAWIDRMPDPTVLDPRIRSMSRLGTVFGGPTIRLARAAEPLLRRQIGAIFAKADVVITPTTAVPPLEADALRGLTGRKTNERITSACPYAWPWNVIGWPGINVPAGLVGGTRPVGVQLLGPGSSEPLLISLAAQLEAAERWQDRWPAFANELAAATP